MNFLARQASRAALPPAVQVEIDRVTDLVERCTNEILLAIDWTVNMELVDATNRASCQEVRREIVRQVRKRLQHRSPRVVSLALSLIETLVKNCGFPLHQEVATEKFMAQMARIARSYSEKTGRDNLEVADMAIDLIQSWGEAFLTQSATLPLFARTYHELRRQGIPFKRQYDESKAPVFTPPVAPGMEVPSTTYQQGGEDFLQSVEASSTMLKDFLYSAAILSDITSNEIFQEVLSQCIRHVRPLQDAIQAKVIDGTEDLDEYFKANDLLQSTLQLYEGIKSGALHLPLPREERGVSVASAQEDSNIENFFADDENFFSSGGGGKISAKPEPALAAEIPALPKPPQKESVPKLPPSRRDSQGKSRPTRSTRAGSTATDLLDFGSLSMNDQSVGKQSSSGSIFDSFSSTPAKPGNATPSLLDSVPSTAGADSIFDFGDDPFSSSAPLPVMTTTTGAKPPLNKSQSTPFDEPEPMVFLPPPRAASPQTFSQTVPSATLPIFPNPAITSTPNYFPSSTPQIPPPMNNNAPIYGTPAYYPQQQPQQQHMPYQVPMFPSQPQGYGFAPPPSSSFLDQPQQQQPSTQPPPGHQAQRTSGSAQNPFDAFF